MFLTLNDLSDNLVFPIRRRVAPQPVTGVIVFSDVFSYFPSRSGIRESSWLFRHLSSNLPHPRSDRLVDSGFSCHHGAVNHQLDVQGYADGASAMYLENGPESIDTPGEVPFERLILPNRLFLISSGH